MLGEGLDVVTQLASNELTRRSLMMVNITRGKHVALRPLAAKIVDFSNKGERSKQRTHMSHHRPQRTRARHSYE